MTPLASAIYAAHPCMRRLTQAQQRREEAALGTLAGVVGERRIIEAIERLAGDRFRCGWVASFERMLEKWPEIQAYLEAPQRMSGIEMVIRHDEYKRVCEAIRLIKAGYSEHMSYSAADKQRLAELRRREAELRAMLGIVV